MPSQSGRKRTSYEDLPGLDKGDLSRLRAPCERTASRRSHGRSASANISCSERARNRPAAGTRAPSSRTASKRSLPPYILTRPAGKRVYSSVFRGPDKKTCAAGGIFDYKTELGTLPRSGSRLPEYRVSSENGPDHRSSSVELSIKGTFTPRIGRSKERSGHARQRSYGEAQYAVDGRRHTGNEHGCIFFLFPCTTY